MTRGTLDVQSQSILSIYTVQSEDFYEEYTIRKRTKKWTIGESHGQSVTFIGNGGTTVGPIRRLRTPPGLATLRPIPPH